MQSLKLSGQLLHELGRQILSGALESGQVLPTVETLSEMNGVSRTVTREALKGLSALGLVESQPKVGTIVCARDHWQWWSREVLQWSVDAKPNQHFLLQLSEVRRVIEPAAVALAAQNGTDKDFQVIREAFERLEQSVGNEEDWAKADYEFHDSIIAASRNELMLSLTRVMRDALLYSRKTTIPILKEKREEPPVAALNQHRAVMDAVCSRDEQGAYQGMTQLLESVKVLIQDSEEGRKQNRNPSRSFQ
ncbi:FadR family transcriptional regulator [Alicyclobacillus tolerans]|uniref:FadR/GntR family transcriptional regulator n=1 Tax=Alicyclobacillus tolerans TaxID=90970 RepID=UPI001F3E0093|nr:FadR/GntR family transcriptional regulator [Alicyclobacillus tolerans]MCF8563460.1 FadR family transcriptional regulator [Alicyclobacillus tolerans]